MSLVFVVHGTPKPQGSKRFVGLSKSGKGLMVESCPDVKSWREAVKWAAIEAMATRQGQGIRGPISVEITFTLPKPKSAPKRMRTWPERKPDLSKLVRSTEDALTDVGAIDDDARIVECICRKVFPGEHPDALSTPGAVIRLALHQQYTENARTQGVVA